jgi:hypothetical protein
VTRRCRLVNSSLDAVRGAHCADDGSHGARLSASRRRSKKLEVITFFLPTVVASLSTLYSEDSVAVIPVHTFVAGGGEHSDQWAPGDKSWKVGGGGRTKPDR